MGSNDSLPPPFPPGEPPRVPPPPPAVPQFPPTGELPVTQAIPPTVQAAPPTQVLPPTQVMPPVGGGAVPPPPPAGPGGPGGGDGAGGSDDPSKKNLVPWIIGAAVLVVALVLIAVFALRDDNESSGAPDTTAGASTTVVEPSTTLAPTTVAPTTAPATVPPTDAPTSTEAPTTTLPGTVVVADDTGTFTVLMLDTFETDTAPVDSESGVKLAAVAGSENLDGFNDPNDHDTFGIGVAVGPADQMPSVDDLLQSLDPGVAVCSDRSTKTDYPTLNGNAQVLLLDGCGTGGASAKVFMVLSFPERNQTMIVGAQGPGPANTDLLDFTQAVVESVVFL